MGTPDRGAVNVRDKPRKTTALASAIRPALLARIALAAFGVWVASIGARMLLLSRRPSFLTESAGRWLLGGVLAHDAVIAPTVFLLGAVLTRFTGARTRQALAAILLIGGSVLIVGLPNALRKGTNANATVNPLDYNRNLAIVLLAVVGGVTLSALAGATRRHRHARHATVSAHDRTAEAPPADSTAEPEDTNPPPQPDTHIAPNPAPRPEDEAGRTQATDTPHTLALPPSDHDEPPRSEPGKATDEQTQKPKQ